MGKRRPTAPRDSGLPTSKGGDWPAWPRHRSQIAQVQLRMQGDRPGLTAWFVGRR